MAQARPVILVVEDHRPTRELVSDFLMAEGYDVESAASGTGGLARVQAGGIDAVLLDLWLPDMDGQSLCRTVRDNKRLDDVRVIVMSADSDSGQRDAALAAGATDFLIKPFDLDELLTAVSDTRPIS